jgi:hypothetical protein
MEVLYQLSYPGGALTIAPRSVQDYAGGLAVGDLFSHSDNNSPRGRSVGVRVGRDEPRGSASAATSLQTVSSLTKAVLAPV